MINFNSVLIVIALFMNCFAEAKPEYIESGALSSIELSFQNHGGEVIPKVKTNDHLTYVCPTQGTQVLKVVKKIKTKSSTIVRLLPTSGKNIRFSSKCLRFVGKYPKARLLNKSEFSKKRYKQLVRLSEPDSPIDLDKDGTADLFFLNYYCKAEDLKYPQPADSDAHKKFDLDYTCSDFYFWPSTNSTPVSYTHLTLPTILLV